MVMTTHTPGVQHVSHTGREAFTATTSVVGVVAALIGAWIEFWADAGTISVFGWDWTVSGLSDFWAPFLMVVGGLLAAGPMALEWIRDRDEHASPWVLSMDAVIALAGVVALVVGIIAFF